MTTFPHEYIARVRLEVEVTADVPITADSCAQALRIAKEKFEGMSLDSLRDLGWKVSHIPSNNYPRIVNIADKEKKFGFADEGGL